MPRTALLTQDELDFIQNMQHNPQLNKRDASSSLLVNGVSQIRDLLTRLAAHEQVTLQASFENQKISFPLHLVEDEFHAQHLRLGVPSIFEDGPRVRPWRLALEAPVFLENVRGRQGALAVREISFKGVLLESRKGLKPPRQFNQWFSPSGYERIALQGNTACTPTGSSRTTPTKPSACASTSCNSTAWLTRSFTSPGPRGQSRCRACRTIVVAGVGASTAPHDPGNRCCCLPAHPAARPRHRRPT